MTERRYAVVTASAGVVLFLLCSLVAQGGPLAHGTFGDVYEYHLYQQHMAAGQWPYRNFFDEYPPLVQPLFYVVGLLPGTFVHAWRWTMVVFGSATLALMVAALASAGATRRRLAILAVTIGVSPLLLGLSIYDEFDFWPGAAHRGRTARVRPAARPHSRTCSSHSRSRRRRTRSCCCRSR